MTVLHFWLAGSLAVLSGPGEMPSPSDGQVCGHFDHQAQPASGQFFWRVFRPAMSASKFLEEAQADLPVTR
jgi:hypothetical protein